MSQPPRRQLLDAAITRFGPRAAIVESPEGEISIRLLTGRWELTVDGNGHKFALEGPGNIVYKCNSFGELKAFLKLK